jgi:murein L,D-transpeptidase YcbB/YkuD
VCDTASTCGTLSVTVTGGQAGNQTGIFSVANPTLAVGQSLNVGLSSAATGYVVGYNASPNIVQASVTNGVTLALTGASAGTDTLSICALAGACSQLSVTVTGPTNTAPANVATAATTTAVAAATPVVAATVQAPAPVPQSGTVTPNATLLAEIQTLQTAVTQILTQVQSMETELGQLAAQVNAGSGSGISASASAASSGTSYNFTELLTVGSQDAEVTALQDRLAALGFYSGPITGYYGTLTEAAVAKYQTAHGITATGYTGPSTRTALNAGN